MSLIYLKQGSKNNIDRYMDIIHNAQANMQRAGFNQWMNGYPDRSNISDDLAKENLYEIIFNNQTAGILAIQTTPEPNYAKIYDGSWSKDQQYATIHRFAIDDHFAGHHLGDSALMCAFALIRQMGLNYVRIDTHAKNGRMKHLIEKAGFAYRGVIHINDPHGNLETVGYDLSLL